MRNYALTQAMASESIGNSPATFFRNWRARRRVAVLVGCGDRILKSLALTEKDVEWAMSLPLSQDPERALEDRSFRRARGDGRLPAFMENALASRPATEGRRHLGVEARCSAGLSGWPHMAWRSQ